MSFTKAKEQYNEERNRRAQRIIYYATAYPDWSMQEIADQVASDFGECDKMTVSRVLKKAGITRS